MSEALFGDYWKLIKTKTKKMVSEIHYFTMALIKNSLLMVYLLGTSIWKVFKCLSLQQILKMPPFAFFDSRKNIIYILVLKMLALSYRASAGQIFVSSKSWNLQTRVDVPDSKLLYPDRPWRKVYASRRSQTENTYVQNFVR